ncbi:24587_t:CDS:1, partial [Racocetra persica]
DQYPLTWWRTNQKWFPVLSKLARKYLAISATLTASERLFSDAGNTMTEKRTSLLPTTFEHLVFLRNNWKITGDMFP